MFNIGSRKSWLMHCVSLAVSPLQSFTMSLSCSALLPTAQLHRWATPCTLPPLLLESTKRKKKNWSFFLGCGFIFCRQAAISRTSEAERLFFDSSCWTLSIDHQRCLVVAAPFRPTSEINRWKHDSRRQLEPKLLLQVLLDLVEGKKIVVFSFNFCASNSFKWRGTCQSQFYG